LEVERVKRNGRNCLILSWDYFEPEDKIARLQKLISGDFKTIEIHPLAKEKKGDLKM
jgi:hypothetical protein